MDFNDIKIIKELGAGMIGTTYLVEKNKKRYALKIQHILPSERKKSLKYEMWRELDLYEYINSLDANDKKFFTQLHCFEIYDNCKHKQKRPFKLPDGDDPFKKRMETLDKSDWCIKLLLDYKGKSTFGQYISTHNLSIKQTYSFIFQMIKIMLILYKGGYSHNDLHFDNVMIQKTKDKYFLFNNKKIPYYGYQLVAIDYGEVFHKKFLIDDKYTQYWFSLFKKNRKKYLFNEIMDSVIHLVNNFNKYMYQCKKKGKIQPWEKKNFDPFGNLIKNIIHKHPDFWNEAKKDFLKNNKEVKKLIEKIENNKNKSVESILKNHKYEDETFKVLNLISNKFQLFHPKLASKYFGWCSYHKYNLPKEDVLKILKSKNTKDLLEFLSSK